MPPGPAQPSIRIASIDVGGGTTDLMITTYYVQQNYALIPCQTFREGFRIAGEDIVREVIQSVLIPAISRALQSAGAAVRTNSSRTASAPTAQTWRKPISISGANMCCAS